MYGLRRCTASLELGDSRPNGRPNSSSESESVAPRVFHGSRQYTQRVPRSDSILLTTAPHVMCRKPLYVPVVSFFGWSTEWVRAFESDKTRIRHRTVDKAVEGGPSEGAGLAEEVRVPFCFCPDAVFFCVPSSFFILPRCFFPPNVCFFRPVCVFFFSRFRDAVAAQEKRKRDNVSKPVVGTKSKMHSGHKKQKRDKKRHLGQLQKN